MPSFKYALPVLAAARLAYGQSCPTKTSVSIENAGDASAVAACSTYSGKITVATGMAGDVSFGELEEIDGDLIIEDNNEIQRVDGGSLKKISGTLSVKRNPKLAALAFPELDEIKKFEMEGLPNLRNLGFDKQVTKIDELSIENTELQDLTGINLNKTNGIRIIANPSISNITMQIKNMTGAIEIKDNNDDVEISFPNLVHAGNMSYRSVANLSLPALKEVSPGAFGIMNSKMSSFYASNFTEVGDALLIVNNTELSDLHVPSLEKVGASFRIESNDKLGEINMPKLEEVLAALDISGKNLSSVKTESLNRVVGVFNLQSSVDLGKSCDAYDELNKKSKLGPKSKYTCKGKLKEVGNAGAGTASGSDDSSDDSAAASVQVSAFIGLAGLFAAMFV